MKSVFLSVGKRGLSIVFQLFGGIRQAAAVIELPAELSRNYNNEKRIFINIAFCDFVLQNGAFSTTEQNQIYKNSLFVRNLHEIQLSNLPSAASVSLPANYILTEISFSLRYFFRSIISNSLK